MRKYLLFFFLLTSNIYYLPSSFAAEPLYITELPNIHEYDLFANSGWDGNWYVGHNHAWMQKLRSVPERDDYKKAFIGAKLGKAKTREQIEKKLAQRISDKEKKLAAVSGKDKKKLLSEIENLKKEKEFSNGIKFYVSLSDDSDFSDDKKYFLVENSEIPFEGDWEEAINNTGSSRWFWVEVPVGKVSRERGNYIAVWSDNPLLDSTELAPIIAAGWSDSKEKSSYLSTNNEGKAPKGIEKSISFFTPALAIKLVPENNFKVSVSIKELKVEKNVVRIFMSAEGEITRIHANLFKGKEEIETGFGITEPPYAITVVDLEKGEYRLILEAEDRFGNRGKSKTKTFTIE